MSKSVDGFGSELEELGPKSIPDVIQCESSESPVNATSAFGETDWFPDEGEVGGRWARARSSVSRWWGCLPPRHSHHFDIVSRDDVALRPGTCTLTVGLEAGHTRALGSLAAAPSRRSERMKVGEAPSRAGQTGESGSTAAVSREQRQDRVV